MSSEMTVAMWTALSGWDRIELGWVSYVALKKLDQKVEFISTAKRGS